MLREAWCFAKQVAEASTGRFPQPLLMWNGKAQPVPTSTITEIADVAPLIVRDGSDRDRETDPDQEQGDRKEALDQRAREPQ